MYRADVSGRHANDALQAGVGVIAKNAAVPVQTLIIETDLPYASKGWSLFRPPAFPITCRMRLGRRFDPRSDVRDFIVELEGYFHDTLIDAPQNQWLCRALAFPRSGNHQRRRFARVVGRHVSGGTLAAIVSQ